LRDYVATGDVKNNEIVSTTKYTFDKKPSRANMSVDRDDVIFAKMKNTVKVVLITKKEEYYIFSTGFSVVRPNKTEIFPNYLLHFFKTNYFQQLKDKDAYGGTQKAINNANISKIKIPKPTIDKQKKIASLLDCIERINKNRIRATNLFNEFISSYFHSIYKQKSLKLKPFTISKICKKIKRYPTFYGINYVDKGIPVIKIGNIMKNGKLEDDLSQYDFITSDVSQRFPETILEYHDLLMAVRGDGSTGKLGYVSNPKLIGANISPNLLRMSIDINIANPIFLFHLLSSNYGKAYINSKINRTAKKTITAEDIKKIKIPLPLISIQNEFASVITGLEGYVERCNIFYEKTQQLRFLVNQQIFGRLSF